jgi:hypothetical protein
MEAQAHTSCNRRAGYYVRETAPPLAPVLCLLDCGTGAATRGNPAHGPTVPTEHIGHGSVSRGRRRDGRYGQKWAGSNGGGRRAEAAVKSSASSRPLGRVPSLSCYRDRERGYSERDPSPQRKRAPSPPTDQRFEGWPLGRVRQAPQSTRAPRPLLVRGSKAGPSEGFDSRLRPLGLRAHY